MIFDKIENMSKYAGAEPLLAKAAEQLTLLSDPTAPRGKHEIDGDSLFAFVNEYSPLPRGDKKFENHHKFIDVQIALSGEEELDVCYIDGEADVPYDEGNDIEFTANGTDISTFVMKPGYFLVLYPGEWHKPGIRRGETGTAVVKTVMKIKA